MANESHLRIDEGIKRGPRRKVDRRPRAALSGQYLPVVSPEQRQVILTETYTRLQAGETTDQIATKYGITGRALRYWLLDDPKADQARRMLINGELARTLDEMKEAKLADSPLPLACAREEFRAWSWIAERRESRLYGPQIAVKNEVVITDQDAGLLTSAQELLALFKAKHEKVVNAAPAAIEEKAIESTDAPDLYFGNH